MDKIIIRIKTGSEYPELAWWFRCGSNAKKPAAHKENFSSKNLRPRRYIGYIEIIDIVRPKYLATLM